MEEMQKISIDTVAKMVETVIDDISGVKDDNRNFNNTILPFAHFEADTIKLISGLYFYS